MIRLGTSNIDMMKLGGRNVTKVYLGNTLVWPDVVYTHDYLTFTAEEANSTVKFSNTGWSSVEYSRDNGYTWNNAMNVTVTLANVGDSVKYRGVLNNYSNLYRFTLTGKISSSGSVMSMYNNNPDDLVIDIEGAFYGLFANQTSLTTAPELPATSLAKGSYEFMFGNCTSLTTSPELPATTVGEDCYMEMFIGCSSLTTSSSIYSLEGERSGYRMFKRCNSLTTVHRLPTAIGTQACNEMFMDCSSLVTAPELPATTLSNYCYDDMFRNCTSLTSAPELPATSLAIWCYANMFKGCSSLVTAPELPATSPVTGCYSHMFENCTSLNYVKHHILRWNTDYLAHWLMNTAAKGKVECPSTSTIPSGTDSGIPTGWTRVNF